MKSVQELWKKRVSEYSKELRKYLRYMLNDHLLFVIIFAIGGGGFTYSQWVQTLQPDFPAPIIMAVVLSVIMAISPVYTFLREADAVFLLPLEGQMKSYFHKGLWISFFFQSYILILVLAAFMPMYAKVTGLGFSVFLLLLIFLLLLKVWNLYVRWFILKFQEKEAHRMDFVIRLGLNFTFLFFLFTQASFYLLAVVMVIMMAYAIYFFFTSKKKTLKWDLIINHEEQRMLMFYRLANMFTDVPKLKGSVHRRKWLDVLMARIPFQQNQTYKFLYMRALLRTSEYFGLYIRLTIISFLIAMFSDSFLVGIISVLLFLYLTGFQLLPMYKRFDLKLWILLYPVSKDIRSSSFGQVINHALLVQAIIVSVPFLIKGMWLEGIIALFASFTFVMAFSQFYVTKRLKKFEESYY